MPADLVNQLKDRRQFLDLMRYVLQLRESKLAMEDLPDSQITLSAELQGVVLVDRLNCLACHTAEQLPLREPMAAGPDLRFVRSRMNPVHVESFIADPHSTKPGTRMPDVLHGLKTSVRDEVAKALTHYVLSLGDGSFVRQPVDLEAAARGEALYHSVGCVACHSPYDQSGSPIVVDSFAPLGEVNDKYNLEGLVALLERPHQSRPNGRMPNLQLTHWEAIDIASYLLSLKGPANVTAVANDGLDESLVELGRNEFVRRGCAQCHQVDVERERWEKIPLLPLEAQAGCLQLEPPGESPRYLLSELERESILAAMRLDRQSIDLEQQLQISLTSLNCVACHQRGGIGGVTVALDEYFQTTDQNLGQQGRMPPTLTGVGAKLQPQWMREVLVSGRSIRPYMQTRMPRFGVHHVEPLIEGFQIVDVEPDIEFATFDDQKVMRDTGLQMAGSQGLNCVACHTYRFEKSETMPSVDLTEMAQRLEKEWFYAYMLDPQKYSRNTVMPSFWPGGTAVRQDLLEGDPGQQVEALWQYLLDGRDARAPRGVIREPLEIIASENAVMLRRSYRGVGKRGIGVGYPSELNLVFDAEQMRVASLWKGKFAEASGVWRGQGSGQVRPLGFDAIAFGPGPEIDHAVRPWEVDESRPPNHRFLGYFLDERQRPTFMYRFENVEIEDFSLDIPAGDSESRTMRRTVKLTCEADRNDIMFRVTTQDQVIQNGDREVVIGDRLALRVITSQAIELIEMEAGNQIRIPLAIEEGNAELELEYEW